MNDQQQAMDHDGVDTLLPWYVNGTLSEAERARVDHHLEDCAECRDNLEFLGRVEEVARLQEPLPLVPKPDAAKLLARLDGNSAGIGRSGSLRFGVAAAIMVAIAIGTMTWLGVFAPADPPNRFETVISPSVDSTLEYIVELRLEVGTDASQVNELLATIGEVTSLESIDDDTIRVHLQSDTLAELQDRIDGLRSIPRVAAAEVVAVHVPVE